MLDIMLLLIEIQISETQLQMLQEIILRYLLHKNCYIVAFHETMVALLSPYYKLCRYHTNHEEAIKYIKQRCNLIIHTFRF